MEVEEAKSILGSRVKYPICMEIAGDLAMWSRNDTGSEKTTYPIPSFSALKGVFESILYIPSAEIIPYKIQICSPIRYQNYAFNYRGEGRKLDIIKKDCACQIKNTVLYKPVYRCFAFVVNSSNKSSKTPNKYKNINHAHSYQDQFNRRLIRGQNYRTPCLGWSEFLTSYVGIFRESTKVQTDINFTIPSMILCCFDSLNEGNLKLSYIQNVEVINGEVCYVK